MFSANQGIKLSLKNSLALFFGTRLLGGLPFGPLDSLLFALIIGFNRGGSAVIKHYALRLILWLNGYTPFNFIKFLDQCAKLILLKKVGGGYIFIHCSTTCRLTYSGCTEKGCYRFKRPELILTAQQLPLDWRSFGVCIVYKRHI
jgi:hypothetical protein